jgi:hypothetical protein
VTSTGHDVSASISWEYVDIQAPRIACDRLFLAMFARQGCDSAPGHLRFRTCRCRKTAACPRYLHQIVDSGDG